jgi:RNase H-fold protein (predicted Holliday junction resolvase)
MVLGLDASTSTIGWAVTNGSVILTAGFVDIKKFETAKEKTFTLTNFIESQDFFPKIEVVHLEAALSGFAGGFTSQQVIIKLSRFNAVFEYILSEKWKIPVKLWNVNTARKCVLGKSREKGVKSKEFVKNQLEKIHDIHKFDVVNKKGNWDERNSDMYDAIVLGLARN